MDGTRGSLKKTFSKIPLATICLCEGVLDYDK